VSLATDDSNPHVRARSRATPQTRSREQVSELKRDEIITIAGRKLRVPRASVSDDAASLTERSSGITKIGDDSLVNLLSRIRQEVKSRKKDKVVVRQYVCACPRFLVCRCMYSC
jgi:hypothetical protein